jgi:hypothetical protein
MIVVHEPPEFLLITQPDHARLAAEMLSLWRGDHLPEHPRRRELLFAVREHDNGWREADAAPRYNAVCQRPHDFRSFPATERLEIWQRGIERFSVDNPYAALLIARHAESLYRRASEVSEAWLRFLSRLEPRRREWLENAGVDAALIDRDYRFLETADLLSLAICSRRQEPFEAGSIHASVQASTLLLSPFPLAGTTTVRVACRRIPDRLYKGDADLGSELAAAPWGEWAIRIAPGPIAP